MPNEKFHLIELNEFIYNFASKGTAFYLEVDGQFIKLQNNTY